VAEIHPRPDLKGQMLYSWPDDFKMASLSLEAINTSLKMADKMNGPAISSDKEQKGQTESLTHL